MSSPRLMCQLSIPGRFDARNIRKRTISGLLLICMMSYQGMAHGAVIPKITTSSTAKSTLMTIRRSTQSPVPVSPISAPTNVAVHGAWVLGASTDKLTWDAVPGAVSYNVYFTTNYDPILTGVTTNSCSVPANLWHSYRYTITAIASSGQESIPSTPISSLGANDPAIQPANPTPFPKGAPKIVYTRVEWNLNSPRVVISWQGHSGYNYFKIYRDTRLIGTGITPVTFIDINVLPGETHKYAVSEVSIGWPNIEQETEKTISSLVTIPASQPTAPSAQVLSVTDIVPNDDGAKIYFTAVLGALDYRAYKVSHPGSVKYSGGGLSIEMNGLDPVAGDDVIVEAVDKLGPFQTLDGMFSPGMQQMDGSVITAINGQGDPSNIPNVIATSAVIHPVPVPIALNGTQVFLDNFRNEQPLVDTPYSQIDSGVTGNPKLTRDVTEGQNDKWIMRTYDAHPGKSHLFFMGSHFMDTLYDRNHILRGKTIVIPKANPIIVPGHVLHVTFEVDAHLSLRRALGVIIGRANDPLIMPTAGGPPTKSGYSFDWQIRADTHKAEVFNNLLPYNVGRDTHMTNPYQPLRGNISGNFYPGGLNGSMESLDNRHKFDLYISSVRFVAIEAGVLVKDEDLTQIVNRDTQLVENQTLNWFNNTPLALNFYHSIYHSDADHIDLLSGEQVPYAFYWLNYRPYADERHWDNMGFEVLNSFPPSVN